MNSLHPPLSLCAPRAIENGNIRQTAAFAIPYYIEMGMYRLQQQQQRWARIIDIRRYRDPICSTYTLHVKGIYYKLVVEVGGRGT